MGKKTKIFTFLWASLFLNTQNICHAFSYDDCVLQGLKGVSSDAAARMIRESCSNKRLDYYKQQEEKTNSEYGSEDSTSIADLAKNFSIESSSFNSIEIENKEKDSDKVISYVKIIVRDVGKDGYCAFDKTKKYSYKVSIKSGGKAKLLFPPSTDRLCYDIYTIRTKKAKWSDFSLSSSVKPLENDPFPERSVGFYPAAPAPAAAPAFDWPAPSSKKR